MNFAIKLRAMGLCVALAGLPGCTSLGSAGAPKPPFNEDADLNTLLKNYNQAASLDSFFSTSAEDAKLTSESRRNKFITARLVLINIRYLQFVKSETADRQALDSATDILALSLNLAGAAVSSGTTKTILAAIAAGVTGSRAIIERDYYYEKTVPALVAQMNVSRKQALVPILQGMGQTIDQYSIANALDNLNDYYNAGTFTGAISAIQATAATSDTSVSAQIADLTKIPQSVIDFKKKVLAWVNTNKNDATKLNDVKAALTALGDTMNTAEMNIGAATTELHRWIQINVTTQDQLTKAQKALGDNHIQL